MRAVQITQFGGPEVLRVVELPDPVPGPGELLIDVDAVGVNYADTHQTENSYLAAQQLPLVPGSEVVGRVAAGPRAGERVLALLAGSGGYAERAVASAELTWPLDDALSDADALALLVQGTTAWHLLRTCADLKPRDTVVVHAAAGGVGSLAVQLAREWGAARVIGTASGEAKAKLATELGADVTVDLSGTTTAEEVTAALCEANDGRRVDVVLEMTGGHVFDGSLYALAPMGRIAVFGMASRVPATPVPPALLMARSLQINGFWLMHALDEPGGLGVILEELTSLVRAGRLRPVLGGSYPLADAARAHRALLGRTTTGKLVLTP